MILLSAKKQTTCCYAKNSQHVNVLMYPYQFKTVKWPLEKIVYYDCSLAMLLQKRVLALSFISLFIQPRVFLAINCYLLLFETYCYCDYNQRKWLGQNRPSEELLKYCCTPNQIVLVTLLNLIKLTWLVYHLAKA